MNYQYELTHFKGDMGHGVASDVQKNWQILMDYKTGEHAFPWISPHVVRMEARSIMSKQLGLLSRPALLNYEVYHGSMSERV